MGFVENWCNSGHLDCQNDGHIAPNSMEEAEESELGAPGTLIPSTFWRRSFGSGSEVESLF